MNIYSNYPLSHLNTFGIAASAEHFAIVRTEHQIREVLARDYPSIYVLGGGSNILLTNDLSGLVLKIDIPGIKIMVRKSDEIIVEVGAGVSWHELVLWSLENELCGIENLALIPGTAGAAPIQNIGAYGVELKDVFYRLEAFHLEKLETSKFDAEECNFGYRNSIFKNEMKGQYIITRIWLKLSITPKLNIDYGDIRNVLAEKGIVSPSVRDVAESVIQIRRSKLPDPSVLGNAGSFFKNPEIQASHFHSLQKAFSDIPHYPLHSDLVKIPAGWLLEKAGWKGKKIGQTGSHENQALVLVNYGNATGTEIKELALAIQKDIFQKFSIKLEAEVSFWG